MTGCDNFCSYCAVPYTRGREQSRPQAEILAEIRRLVSAGYKEITLLGQNVNSYRYDFVTLLKKIDTIPGDYRVYYYSNHPKDVSEKLINTMPELKHFPHYLHLPLQSGDDEILERMNRHYTVEQYLDLVVKIRQTVPDIVFTTDIIVGFPGEGPKEFQKTLQVVNKVKFEMIFIGQYSPRLGTASSKMKDNVSLEAKKERERALTDALRNHLAVVNRRFVGQELRILIDEKKGDKYYGRTEGYKVVELKTDQTLEVGRFYEVLIKKAEPWKLIGTLVV
jgi:tRNA-2-methylthio-N6-dimethylallyladenosine synthase